MAQAAYRTLVGIPGTATAITDAPTTYLGACRFRITDASKRLLDSDTAVVVKFAATRGGAKHAIDAENVAVNYAGGIVTVLPDSGFDESACASAFIFVSGKYIPFTHIGGANNYSLEMSTEVLEDTNFEAANANDGYRTRLTGLIDVSVSVSAYSPLNKAFMTRLQERQNVVLSIRVGNAEHITGRFVVESVSSAGEVGGIETEDISFQLSDDVSRRFSWV